MTIEDIEREVTSCKAHKSWCRSYYPTHVGDWLIQRVKELEADRDAWESTAKLAAKNEIQPCGHREQFYYTEDGGKTIHCMGCQVKELEERIKKGEER